ncbi:MAG: hypothetical protein NW214_13145 [Pseudanabaenaceae cyanobacterium bins.39]|nr:hypothetical protein [Pseudanabaenaceae cyanobacterium bins.39]
METLTATAIVTLLFSEAIKESGKAVGKGVVEGVTHVFTLIREKLQAAGTEGLLTRAEKQPTDEKTLVNSDLAPFLKELSRNGFEDNFKAITRSNIGISSDEVEKF